MIDTHAHLYLDAFAEDREDMILRARDAGVEAICLPNIDAQSIGPMLELCDRWPGFLHPMMGLHPCDVKEDFEEVLDRMYPWFAQRNMVAVGETGIDLYWDKSTLPLQREAFLIQLKWAAELNLPLVIHARDSFDELFEIMDRAHTPGLRGIFHCFTGTRAQAGHIMSYGTFLMGIGGVITYPRSGLSEALKGVDPSFLVLETDAPFLPPVPHRGKRNESSYLTHILRALATALDMPEEEVARLTTENARRMFTLQSPPAT